MSDVLRRLWVRPWDTTARHGQSGARPWGTGSRAVGRSPKTKHLTQTAAPAPAPPAQRTHPASGPGPRPHLSFCFIQTPLTPPPLLHGHSHKGAILGCTWLSCPSLPAWLHSHRLLGTRLGAVGLSTQFLSRKRQRHQGPGRDTRPSLSFVPRLSGTNTSFHLGDTWHLCPLNEAESSGPACHTPSGPPSPRRSIFPSQTARDAP